MKYIIHIGTHKTGSTALQRFLFVNRDQLLAKGILYPLVGVMDCAHHELAWAVRSGDQGKVDELLRAIETEATATGVGRIVLSSEEFEFIRNKNSLRPFFARKPTVVLFVRRQDSYLESEYNQHIRMYNLRYPHDIYRFYFHHDFMPRFNYRFICDFWEPQSDTRSVKVINYDRCLSDRLGIFKEFLARIGIDWDERFVLPEERESNVSIANLGTLYLARMNRRGLSPERHQAAIHMMVRMFRDAPKMPLLSLDERAVLWRRFSATNEYMQKHYGTEPFVKPGEPGDGIESLDFCEDFDPDLFGIMMDEVLKIQSVESTG